jgi:hypothetical protein
MKFGLFFTGIARVVPPPPGFNKEAVSRGLERSATRLAHGCTLRAHFCPSPTRTSRESFGRRTHD